MQQIKPERNPMKTLVAVAQFAPVVLDLKKCVDKACKIIEEAGMKKVRLLAFPETWIPVYPLWSDMGSYSEWGNVPAMELFRHGVPAVLMTSRCGGRE
jgi:predicted amidohydrolase